MDLPSAGDFGLNYVESAIEVVGAEKVGGGVKLFSGILVLNNGAALVFRASLGKQKTDPPSGGLENRHEVPEQINTDADRSVICSGTGGGLWWGAESLAFRAKGSAGK